MDTIFKEIKHALDTPTGLYLRAALAGIVGNVILLAFFSAILSPSTLLQLLPATTAFNGAAAGYGLRDKSREAPHPISVCVSLAALLTITASLGLGLLYPWESMVDGTWLLCIFIPTVIFTFLGYWLARKSHQLKSSQSHSTLYEEV